MYIFMYTIHRNIFTYICTYVYIYFSKNVYVSCSTVVCMLVCKHIYDFSLIITCRDRCCVCVGVNRDVSNILIENFIIMLCILTHMYTRIHTCVHTSLERERERENKETRMIGKQRGKRHSTSMP